MNSKPKIATLASHTALQILKGAKEENFETLLICTPEREKFYRRFKLASHYFMISDFKSILNDEVQKKLNALNAVIIPHGSFIEYVGAKEFLDFKVPMFGNKKVFEWESDRRKTYEWFKKAGIKIPIDFKKPEDIDRLTMVKYHGAKGGKGYMLVKSAKEFYDTFGKFNPETMSLQEYILGTRFYPHFFYSTLEKENELMGIDIRYETNADGLPRMPTDVYMPPTYVITGNTPVVIRESLLPELYDMADKITKASQELFKPGLTGPYCIELVCTDKLEMVVFELSGRIVAGTNVWLPGSPYTYLKYGELISTGRRIAIEIKKAVEEKRLDEVVS